MTRFIRLATLILAGFLVAQTPAPALAGTACNGPNNGVLDPGEECETGACCNTATCTRKGPATVCRASTGNAICDPAETCGVLVNAVDEPCPTDVIGAPGTVCEIDTTVCVSHTCNSTGNCIHSDTTVSCDDGIFCNGMDVCAGGGCQHAGDPCASGDECNNLCNDTTDSCAVPAGTSCTADSNPCTLDQCDGLGACAHPAGNAAALCRSSAGVCDVAETCTGSTTSCPPDGFASTGTVCRTLAGVCDTVEMCSGSTALCPADIFATSSVCRASAGVCDVAESCTGSTASCPADDFVVSGTGCRESAGVCDVAESCTGSSAACPLDAFASPTILCRGSAGVCDVTENCTGSTATCPDDAKSTATCRALAGGCDVVETCDGSSDSCPPDGFAGAGTVCRTPAGVCDTVEMCSGSTALCPADIFATSSVCRAAAGVCDVAESCTGSTASCPADDFVVSGTGCRESAGVCDVAESCTGSSAACPLDAFASPTILCRGSAGVCDVTETCTGSTATCPDDAKSTATCRALTGGCDVVETCDGSSDSCPPDEVLPAPATCRSLAGACDVIETCDGSSNACPADSFQPPKTPCRAAGGVCDLSESCAGSTASCPADAKSTALCRASTGECDVDESCDGAGNDCPADGFVSSGFSCTADSNPCTNDECDGAGACIHPDNTAPCDDGSFCTIDDTCSGGECFGGSPNLCSDSNACTDDSCDEEVDTCIHVNNTGACDDGLFCNGVDSCVEGECTSHTGDPCSEGGECQTTCDETFDHCFNTQGTECSSDENVCTDDACDGAGTCAHNPNSVPCDDALFCNGTDTCSGGSCSMHAGNVCSGECARSCDEKNQACDFDPPGTGCTDDGQVCTSDLCDDAGSCLHQPISGPCDDENACTRDDQCANGVCAGSAPVLADMCPWTVLMREDPEIDTCKLGLGSLVEGDVCGGIVVVRGQAGVDGNVVSGKDVGPKVLRLALSTIVTEDIVSDGAGAKAKPGQSKLPYTLPPVQSLAPGSMQAKDDASGFYDLTGGHPLAADCVAARGAFAAAATYMDALPQTAALPKITPDVPPPPIVAPLPGELNVIDIPRVKTPGGATVELDGGGSSSTVMVVRVAGRLTLRAHNTISLVGGLRPENVLIYTKGRRCVFGDVVDGVGTLLCVNGRLKVGHRVTWTGALYGAARVLKVGDNDMVDYLPFQGF